MTIQAYTLTMADKQSLHGDEQCAICQDNMGKDQHLKAHTQAVGQTVMHFFHANCFDRWLSVKAECPLCKVFITVSSSANTQARVRAGIEARVQQAARDAFNRFEDFEINDRDRLQASFMMYQSPTMYGDGSCIIL
jgi:hypothetical protein